MPSFADVRIEQPTASPLPHMAIQQEHTPVGQDVPQWQRDTIRDTPEGYRITLAPSMEESAEDEHAERQADSMAERVVNEAPSGGQPLAAEIARRPAATARRAIQRKRIALPESVPLCGRRLTHVDIEAPRWRDLEPCVPRGVPVYRMNIVGRQVSPATTGKGRIIFNLHIGYYRDPATGRYCAVMDDSKQCVAGRCIKQCFLTLEEVWEAIKELLLDVLEVLGIIVLIIILALVLRGLRVPSPGPAPVPVMASRGKQTKSSTAVV